MLVTFLKAMLACAVIGLVATANAQTVLVVGNSMTSSNSTFTTNLSKLSGLTFQFDSTVNFSSIDLSPYSAVWLDGFSQYFSLASLTPYLNAGGRVLVQNPGFGSEPLSEYPATAGISETFTDRNSIRVVNPANALNAGLTNANLSGWNQSAFGFFTGLPEGWTALSDTGQSDELITIARTFGSGTLIYTHLGISQSLSASDLPVNSGQVTALRNYLSVSAPESSTLILVGVGLSFAAAVKFRGRVQRVTRKTQAC